MKDGLPEYLLQVPSTPVIHPTGAGAGRVLDQGIAHLARLIQDTYIQWDTSGRNALPQRLSPVVKVAAWVLALAGVSMLSSPAAHSAIAVIAFLGVVGSGMRPLDFYPRVWVISLVFGLLVPLPSLVLRPDGVSLAAAGFNLIGLFARSFNSLTLTFLLLWTTPFPEILGGLKTLRVPGTILWIVSLTRQYLFLFARTVQEMHLARKSRQVTGVRSGDIRGWEAERIADLWRMLDKRCADVTAAIRSRTVDPAVQGRTL